MSHNVQNVLIHEMRDFYRYCLEVVRQRGSGLKAGIPQPFWGGALLLAAYTVRHHLQAPPNRTVKLSTPSAHQRRRGKDLYRGKPSRRVFPRRCEEQRRPGERHLGSKGGHLYSRWAVTLCLNIWSSLGRDTCYGVAGVMCFVSALFATC